MRRPETAIVRPASDGDPKTRSQQTSIAVCTPSAVHGLGSPEPASRRERPVTWLVDSEIVAMSRDDVPTSSAVM